MTAAGEESSRVSNDLPIEKKFRILVEITRASHFAWREAALKRCPDVDPGELVNEMWDINGVRTAEAYLKHLDPSGDIVGPCPWHRWHEDLELLPEDRPGCDRWFQATIRTINEKLGTNLRFETLSALPEGGDCCLRRIWREEK
jgi:hypothetical protein